MLLKQNYIPKKYNFYTTKIDKQNNLVYRPFSEKGLVVINQEALFLLDQINNKKTIYDIFLIVKNIQPSIKIDNILPTFEKLLSANVIYFDKVNTVKKNTFTTSSNLGVWMHITNQCNLRCTYCYVNKTNQEMSIETGKKSLQTIIKQATKYNFKKITVKLSGGEALLKMNKILFLVKFGKEIAKKNNIQISFVVMTNGVLLTDKVCEKLKKENIRVALSLDGLKEYHDKQRTFINGLGTFKYVEKGLLNLQKYKIPFNVSVTITDYNLENIPNLTKYLLKKNIPFAFNFYRENFYTKNSLNKHNNKKLITYLKIAYKIIQENPPEYKIINGLLDRVNFKYPHTHTCGMGKNYIVIRHDGSIVSCQMTLDKPIGSIDNLDLINLIRTNTIAKNPKDLHVNNKSICKDCFWKYICCGGCPLLSLETTGSCNTKSPYCEVYKALIPEVLKIEAQRILKYGETKNTQN